MATRSREDLPPWMPSRPFSEGGPLEPRREREDQARAPRQNLKPKAPMDRRRLGEVLHSSGSAADELLGTMREQERRGVRDVSHAITPERFQGMKLKKFNVGIKPGGVGGGRFSEASLGVSLDGSAAPRKLKERRAGRSSSLKDLSLTGCSVDSELYNPISLPYFDAHNDVDDDDEEGMKNVRPSLHRLDEANANATKESFLEDGELKQGKYFLLQMPAVLPDLIEGLEDDGAKEGDASSIMQYPDGLLGKLRIHKSGKVRMEIGGMPFCVDQGCETFFQQDLACICPDEFYDLGPVRSRAILTPDVDALLAGQGEFVDEHRAEQRAAAFAAATGLRASARPAAAPT